MGLNLIHLLNLIRDFCESVPEDYDYEEDETCLYSVMRDSLIQGIDRWTTYALQNNNNNNKLSIYQKCKMITDKYKGMAEPCALLLAFINIEHGEDYKNFLRQFF